MHGDVAVSAKREHYTKGLNRFVENPGVMVMVHASVLQEKVNQKLQKPNWSGLHRELKRGSTCYYS